MDFGATDVQVAKAKVAQSFFCYTERSTLLPTCHALLTLGWPSGMVFYPDDCPWIDLDARFIYSVGIRGDGTLVAGRKPWDDMLDYPVLLPKGTYVKVSGDPYFSGCALSVDGRLSCWDHAGVLTRNVPE